MVASVIKAFLSSKGQGKRGSLLVTTEEYKKIGEL